MIGLIVFALLAAQQAATPSNDTGEDIVVVARPQGCITKLADATLTDSEFNRHAREWAAGKRVRVIARADADIDCLTKIAFKLADRGVRAMEFVDPRGRAPMPIRGLPTRETMSGGTSSGSAEPDVTERERRFNATRAAKLILQGKCAEARELVLKGGDLSAAADVAQICRTP